MLWGELPQAALDDWFCELVANPRDFAMLGIFADWLGDHDCRAEEAVRWLASYERWPRSYCDWFNENYAWVCEDDGDELPGAFFTSGSYPDDQVQHKTLNEIRLQSFGHAIRFVVENFGLVRGVVPKARSLAAKVRAEAQRSAQTA